MEVQGGGDIGIPVTDSWWCMAKTSTVLYGKYHAIKKKKRKMFPSQFSVSGAAWPLRNLPNAKLPHPLLPQQASNPHRQKTQREDSLHCYPLSKPVLVTFISVLSI